MIFEKKVQFGNSSNWVTKLVTPNNTFVPESKNPVEVFEDMLEVLVRLLSNIFYTLF